MANRKYGPTRRPGLIGQAGPMAPEPLEDEVDASWKTPGDDDTEAFITFHISEGADEHSGALEALACHRALRERLWWADHEILGWLDVLDERADESEAPPPVEGDEPGA